MNKCFYNLGMSKKKKRNIKDERTNLRYMDKSDINIKLKKKDERQMFVL